MLHAYVKSNKSHFIVFILTRPTRLYSIYTAAIAIKELYYLTTHTSLSPIWLGFAPSFVNYKKGALDGSLWVLRLLPPLKRVAMIWVQDVSAIVPVRP